MSTYIIGDVQGCFEQLQQLLEHIQYDPKQDRLGFAGDLVNRGPQSLETLRFIKNLNDPIVVLGNHDLYLIALAYNIKDDTASEHLEPILTAPDKHELIDWLCQQKLAHYDAAENYLLVHAGIPPIWTLQQTRQYAEEIQSTLRGDQRIAYLKSMYGNQPDEWNENLSGWDRLRYITNALTRIRFCDAQGKLDLTTKTAQSPDPKRFKPWFEWIQPETDILFGHWASLEGRCDLPRFYALDTGCVWGGALTTIRLEDRKMFTLEHSL